VVIFSRSTCVMYKSCAENTYAAVQTGIKLIQYIYIVYREIRTEGLKIAHTDVKRGSWCFPWRIIDVYTKNLSGKKNASGRRNASSGEMSMMIRVRNQKMPIGRITDRNGCEDCGGGRTIGTFKRICIVSTSRRPMCASGYVLLYIRIYIAVTSVRPCPTSISVCAASAAATQHYNMYPLPARSRSPGSHSLFPLHLARPSSCRRSRACVSCLCTNAK